MTLVNLQAITDSTPLSQAFALAVNIDKAREQIEGLSGSVFSRLRREARDVCEQFLALHDNDWSAVNKAALRAKFKANVEAGEKSYQGGDLDDKAKRTWIQYKSNIAKALGLGFSFVENPEVGVSKLNKWNKDEEARLEAEADAAANAAHKAQHGVELVDKNSKDETVAKTGQAGQASSSGNTISFANDEQQAAFEAMLKLMVEVSKTDPSKLSGPIKSMTNQLTQAKAALAKLAGQAAQAKVANG